MTEKTVYLVPTMHGDKDDAKSISSRLRQIQSMHQRFTMGVEDCPSSSYNDYKTKSEQEVIEQFFDRGNKGYREFKMLEALEHRNLRRTDIQIFGIDAEKEPKEKALGLIRQYNAILGTVAIFTNLKDQSEIAEKGLLVLKDSLDLREPEMIRNILDLYKNSDLPVVVTLGGAHVLNIKDELSKFVPIELVEDSEQKANSTKRLHISALQIENKAVKSIEDNNVKDTFTLTKYVLFTNIYYDKTGKSREKPLDEYAERVVLSDSVQELNKIFNDLRGLERK